MNNSTTTLKGDVLLLNQMELVIPTTVAGTLYGIAFSLFCLYVHSLVTRFQDGERKRQAKFMLVYSAVIMLCGLYYLVSNVWLIQDVYIKHSNYPGGPYRYIVKEDFHTPVVTTGTTCQLATDVLTSAIQVWRVWVIWSATRYAKLAVLLPLVCFLTFVALHLRTIILEATLPGEKLAHLDIKTEVAALAIQGATTILCTLLISLLLVFQFWRQRELIGNTGGSVGYMRITAVLVESYALESIWLLVSAIPNGNVPASTFFSETQEYIEIIAYLLVQYRVARGKAYGPGMQREQTGQISSLHWNHSNHAATQFGVTSEAGMDDQVFVNSEASKV